MRDTKGHRSWKYGNPWSPILRQLYRRVPDVSFQPQLQGRIRGSRRTSDQVFCRRSWSFCLNVVQQADVHICVCATCCSLEATSICPVSQPDDPDMTHAGINPESLPGETSP